MGGNGVFFGFGKRDGIGEIVTLGKKRGGEGEKGVADGKLCRLINVAVGICAYVETENARVYGIGVIIFNRKGKNENFRAFRRGNLPSTSH